MPSNPAPEPERPAVSALADRCVQCGLCLPHCPTYRLDRSEAESPRGRIALAHGLATGILPASATTDLHLDHCLGCRRCEQVCPAGVEYGALLVATRRLQRERRRAGPRQRLVEALCARPALLDSLLGVYRALFRLVPARMRLLPRPPRRLEPPPSATVGAPSRPALSVPPPLKHEEPGAGQRHARVALFTGCVGRRYDAPAQAALIALCRALSVELAIAPFQTCCGALHDHAGNGGQADALAARNRAAFAGCDRVLTTASGCHEAIAASFSDPVVAEDALVFLARQLDRLRFAPAEGRVALHLPCSQRGVPGSVAAVRQLLAAVPGLDLIELPDTGCCGAAGSHMLDFPGRAAALRQPVLDAARRSGAVTLLSANVGCRLHLDPGARIVVMHPLEFLAEHLNTEPQQ